MKKILLTALLVGGTFVGAFAHGHHRHHGPRGHRPPPRPVIVRPLPPPPPPVIINPIYPLVRPIVISPVPVIVKPPYYRHR